MEFQCSEKPENKPFDGNLLFKKGKKTIKKSFFRFYLNKFSYIILVVIMIDNLESSDRLIK